jgi:hypothetical protein
MTTTPVTRQDPAAAAPANINSPAATPRRGVMMSSIKP